MVLSISGVFGVWQVVVVGGAARPQLRAIRREELILGGGQSGTNRCYQEQSVTGFYRLESRDNQSAKMVMNGRESGSRWYLARGLQQWRTRTNSRR